MRRLGGGGGEVSVFGTASKGIFSGKFFPSNLNTTLRVSKLVGQTEEQNQ
jgi:hypothetical protein